MKRKIWFISSVLIVLATCIMAAFSANSISRIRGSFTPDPSWTGGHPGNIIFDIGSVNSGYTATRDADGYLSGFFWLGTVGWSTFAQCEDSGGVPLCNSRIICPADILQNPNQNCPVEGYAWSKNAGWIVLSGSSIGSSSTGVYYNPTTRLIEGWAWNKGLGWVPFYAVTENQSLGIDPITSTGITMDGISIEFVGKIAVIGNIAGTRIFDLPNQNVGYVFTLAKHAVIMNTINQNLALLARNISDADLRNPSSVFNFLIEKTQDYVFAFGDTWPVGKETIVVYGHDIVLDTTNTIGQDDGTIRALIALKDENGNGGNIIVSDKVKEIYALIYAEGSLFSGEKTMTGYIDNYVAHSAFNIPQKQLYIKGLLISKNTISGARQNPVSCPVSTESCTQATAELYDLNYFRTYDPTDPTQKAVPYSDPRLDNASMVIEYDDAILSAPPPGLANTLQ